MKENEKEKCCHVSIRKGLKIPSHIPCETLHFYLVVCLTDDYSSIQKLAESHIVKLWLFFDERLQYDKALISYMLCNLFMHTVVNIHFIFTV